MCFPLKKTQMFDIFEIFYWCSLPVALAVQYTVQKFEKKTTRKLSLPKIMLIQNEISNSQHRNNQTIKQINNIFDDDELEHLKF